LKGKAPEKSNDDEEKADELNEEVEDK